MQRQEASQVVAGLNSLEHIVENFLISGKDLFEYEQYVEYRQESALVCFIKLYNEIKEYYSNPETELNLVSPETLLDDPKWQKIQVLAQKTKCALENFTSRLS